MFNRANEQNMRGENKATLTNCDTNHDHRFFFFLVAIMLLARRRGFVVGDECPQHTHTQGERERAESDYVFCASSRQQRTTSGIKKKNTPVCWLGLCATRNKYSRVVGRSSVGEPSGTPTSSRWSWVRLPPPVSFGVRSTQQLRLLWETASERRKERTIAEGREKGTCCCRV